MSTVEGFVGVLLAVAVITGLARTGGLPAQPLLVVAGLIAGFLPFVPTPHVPPQIVFAAFLPPILYVSSIRFASENIREAARPIGFLATGLVIFTVVLTAGAAHYAIGLAWAPAFVLGAVVAPTDPVAATGIIRRLGAPTRLATILEGEALLNDGTALVTYQVAIGAVGAATFSLGDAAGKFAVDSLGGIAVGAAVAWVVGCVRRRVDDVSIETTLSVVLAFGSFVLADRLGVSGILATVAAGVVIGLGRSEMSSPETRLRATALWDSLGFFAESSLFLLIGLQFESVASDVGPPPLEVVGDALVVVAAVVAARALWMYTIPYLVRGLRRVGSEETLSPRELLVLTASGMRGAVSVAAALAIPLTVAGAGFPNRPLIIVCAYGTVIATMVVTSLTLASLVRALGLEEGEEQRRRRVEASLRLTHAALERAEELARDGRFSESALQRARELYEMRLIRIRGQHPDEERDGGGSPAHEYQDLRRRLIAAERDALRGLRSGHQVEGETLRELETQLDLEEARLPG